MSEEKVDEKAFEKLAEDFKREFGDKGGFFGGSGDDVSSQKLMQDFISIGKNLGMITEIRDPLGMTIWDAFAFYCRWLGKMALASFAEYIGKWYRVNMASKNRERAKEFLEGWGYVYSEEFRRKFDVFEELGLGGGRK